MVVRRILNVFNQAAMALADAPVVGRLVGGYITPITYRGRRSGRTFTLPVGYRRTGNTVTIAVRLADRKNWWRNFTGAGGRLTIRLDGAERTGHAVARRTGARRAEVVLELDRQG